MPTAAPIASRQHPLVRQCRAVAAGRGDAGLVLLDGEHVCRAALDAGVPFDAVLTDGRAADLIAALRAAGAPVHDATPAVLDAASPVRAPSGVVALARWQPASLSAALPDRGGLAVALIDVQDPGNVGSVIRSADALGAAAVLALGATADPAGWKALRGAMGSTFRLPIARAAVEEGLAAARAAGWRLVATVPRDGTALNQLPFDRSTLLLLGNEGAGLPEAVQRHTTAQLTIPMRTGVESLNVATTAALVLYEAQRRRAGARP